MGYIAAWLLNTPGKFRNHIACAAACGEYLAVVVVCFVYDLCWCNTVINQRLTAQSAG